MKKNFTQATGYHLILTLFTFLICFSSQAQTSPKLKFRQPHLVSGTDGQVGATYKFSNVAPNINAYISIENIYNGAVLKNIDDSTLGYYDAWQPTVGGPGTFGSSYIKWQVRFDSANAPYIYSTLNASAIDVDGDNVRVREYTEVNGQSSYSIPTQITSLLTISSYNDSDNVKGTDASTTNLKALGPVLNRTGIDTLSQDVRINYVFSNKSQFKIYTGSEVDNNGSSGAIATDRYHCIYFMDITGSLNVLPLSYCSLNASIANSAVNVNWTMNADVDNHHFEVERSFDQTAFSSIGVVLGPQSAKSNLDLYNFSDKSPEVLSHNVAYYRLKIYDANGNYAYSAVKTIRFSNNAPAADINVKVLPNPYFDKISVSFESNAAGRAEVRLISTTGVVVKELGSKAIIGTNTLELQDLSSQAPGLYIVSISVNDQVITHKKVIKM